MNKEHYTPPKIWQFTSENGGTYASINRPDAGARFKKSLPKGKHPHQLYSLGTPNGIKVNIMFEELLELGIDDAEYDAWLINIIDAEQFGDEFVNINPNSKIPAMVDQSQNPPLAIFESGSILFYLAEKFQQFLPSEIHQRTATLNWLFWQMGSAPYLGGGFGHFYKYAHDKQAYPIDRFTMETKRQLDVLNKHLERNKYMIGKTYTIADMAIFPWYGRLVLGKTYGPEAATFLNAKSYPHLINWSHQLEQRPAIKRAVRVNKLNPKDGIKERHSKNDL